MKKNKFNAKKVTIDGHTFDSQKEGNYYRRLKLLKNAKNRDERVLHIELQPLFKVVINENNICKYKADFKVQYHNRTEYIDVKGYKKGAAYQLFRLKKKLVEALFNVEIIEI